MCDEFLMGCTLLTAFVILVATLTGYVDIVLNHIVFLE